MFFQTKQPAPRQVWAIQPSREYLYKTVGHTGLPMKVYLPDTAADFKEEPDFFFLTIHGGAWQAIRPADGPWDGGFLDYQAKYYAARGFCSAAISYRSIDFDASTTVQDLIDDCRDAVLFMKEHFHPKQIILIGESAGAHLALSVAIQERSNAATGISAIIAANPVVDCTRSRWDFTAPTEQMRYRLSPLFQVHPLPAKVLCLHGDADPVVDYRQTKEFCEKMRAVGNQCDFLLIPDALHAFLLMGYRSSPKQVQHYMSLIDNWLDAQF